MKGRKSVLGLLHRQPVPFAGVLPVLIAGAAVLVDWVTWIELNESIVYSVPLILAGFARNRRLLWSLTLFLAATTFAVYYVQAPPGAFALREPFFIDRVLAFVTLLCTAGLLHAWTVAIDAIEAQSLNIKAQNEQLDDANRALLRLKEEISRQNEELDQRRQAAEDASNRKTRLLAAVSHDIRSPLNAISLMAQVIGRAADDPSLAAEIPGIAQRLQANAVSMADLVSDILDISTFDSGRVELRESEFSLNELLAEECRQLLPLAQAKDLSLSIEQSAPIRIRTDRSKLSRVLTNLVTNAIKFTEKGGVSLSAGISSADEVAIRVRDTGIGIAAESMDQIFDEFAQLFDRSDGRSKGWGLGLAICRRLSDAMGATITVESEPNRGSCFAVRLPSSCIVTSLHAGR
jgi:signal transduction histidine kinase